MAREGWRAIMFVIFKIEMLQKYFKIVFKDRNSPYFGACLKKENSGRVKNV